MVFSSTTFLFLFLPLVLLLYFARQSLSWRNTVLLVASLFFYAWGEGWLVLAMLTSIGVNFTAGKAMGGTEASKRKWLLVVALIFNLGLLAFFKYANFLADNLNALLEKLELPLLYLPDIHLPIGISFFTFQAISYVVDVYRGSIPAQSDPFRLGLYIALFPQLIAGPIIRYRDIRESIDSRQSSMKGLSKGAQRFIIGLAKKVLIADTLGLVADQIFSAPADALAPGAAWLGVICYAFQIYYDFSGYSDMAIGLGRIFGFHFLENFSYPYLSRSLREFWRRWHISLSTWFRDYLYIPLGGNRRSATRTFFNLGLVFFLCGLWHGASWNFVVWGLFHGLFLMLERTAFGKWMAGSPAWVQHLYLLGVVLTGWVFFRAEDLSQAFTYLSALAGQALEDRYYSGLFLDRQLWVTLGVAAVFAGPVYPALEKKVRAKRNLVLKGLQLAGLALLLAWSLAAIIASTYQPFIYFRF